MTVFLVVSLVRKWMSFIWSVFFLVYSIEATHNYLGIQQHINCLNKLKGNYVLWPVSVTNLLKPNIHHKQAKSDQMWRRLN